MRSHRHPSTQPRRLSGRGFTMIELMVVIVVIAILVGLLLPAIGGVQNRVRVTQVQTQLTRLSAAIVSFKNQYGIEPPSGIILYERPEGSSTTPNWGNDGRGAAYEAARRRSRSLMTQMWPQFDFTNGGVTTGWDINGDGTFGGEPLYLEPGEALVFFLGGLPDHSGGVGRIALLGFASNPRNPFARGTNVKYQKGSYEFETARLIDGDPVPDGLPEFLDPYPGQTAPILYFSSYDGNGYRPNDFPGLKYGAGPPYDKTLPMRPYGQGSNPNAQPFNKSSYQLISPGPDKLYGPGAPYDPESKTDEPLPDYTVPGLTPAVTISLSDRNAERDNITNFSSGKLVP